MNCPLLYCLFSLIMGSFCLVQSHESANIKQSTRFFLIRHGRTDWNDAGRIQGHSDIPLNAKGTQQAAKVAQLLARHVQKIDVIYSSDLQRAVSTAQAISTTFGPSIITDPILRESFMAEAEGMHEDEFHKKYDNRHTELDALYPNRWERWHYHSVPDAETKADLIDRIETALNAIAEDNKGKTVAVVTHGAVIKTLIMHYTEKIMHTPNCCVAEFEYNHDTQSLAFIKLQHIEN
jgi:2,3-bisphosphoglycerate-dependent phosphoglycerate mutase